MRKHTYVGALIPQQGYLMMITLRHADEVIPVGELDAPKGRALEPKERIWPASSSRRFPVNSIPKLIAMSTKSEFVN